MSGLDAMLRVHRGLAQQAPGSDASTLRALEPLPKLGPASRVLDVGCGPGRQTLALARETGAHVIGVDVLPDFLQQLEEGAQEDGLSDRIEAQRKSMTDLDFDDGSFDVVWSEGAIYIMGFAAGLAAWRRLVKPEGHVVVSELSWLVDARPAEAEAFWSDAYPAMADVDTNCARAEEAGYDVLRHFALPDSDWWDYYLPIEKRLPGLRDELAGDAEGLAVVDETAREIEQYRRFGGSYGYVFYVLQRGD